METEAPPHNLKPYSNEKLSEIDLERQLALANFGYFQQVVFGFAPDQLHTEWAMLLDGRAQQRHTCNDRYRRKKNWICDCPIEFHEDFTADAWRYMMLMAPRNHAKTTVFTVGYSLWRIAKDPRVRIVIVSATSTQAKSFLRQISSNLEKNEKFIELFGNLVPQMPEKWTQDEIIVERSGNDLKDPTVSATGTGGPILSKRADIVICDDILSRDNTRTAMRREDTRLWFNEVLKPVLEPTVGQMLVVGTAWHLSDLYHDLMRMKSYNIRLRYDAIVDEVRKVTLWPARWPWAELMGELEQMGTSSFNKAYRNLVTDAATKVFKRPPLDRALDRGYGRTLIYKLNYSSWDLGELVVSMGVDLAISEKDTSDFCGFAVLGETPTGMKIPLALIEERLSFAEQQKMISDLARRFRPSIIVVESNGYQAALTRDLSDATSLPIVAYNTGGEKFDEEIGLNSIAVEFENDKWILPCNPRSPHTVEIVDKLVEAMEAFPNGHTADILMALWFANGGLRMLRYDKSGTEGSAEVGELDIYNMQRR